MDYALNNLQRVICRNNQPTNQQVTMNEFESQLMYYSYGI